MNELNRVKCESRVSGIRELDPAMVKQVSGGCVRVVVRHPNGKVQVGFFRCGRKH